MMRIVVLGLLVALGILTGCRKEVEKLVVQQVDKQYSWSAAGGPLLNGTDKIILGMCKDATSLYLQQPGVLGRLTPRPTSQLRYYRAALAPLPTDLQIRIPFTADFFTGCVTRYDSVLAIGPTKDPATSNYVNTIRLRQLDPLATGIQTNYFDFWRFGAINRNNYLLLSYNTSLSFNDPLLHFVLAKVNPQPYQPVQLQARTLTIPRATGLSGADVRWLVAIDDYFLLCCGTAGLFKVKEDGSVKKVYGYTLSDSCYKWQGKLYVVEEYTSLLRSSDDGETWQRYQLSDDKLSFTTYHPIGDSLVVATHGAGTNSLYTLNWRNQGYTLRSLKNDGLNGGSISGLEQLGDTVYLGTTSGLYKRPLSTFFESKP